MQVAHDAENPPKSTAFWVSTAFTIGGYLTALRIGNARPPHPRTFCIFRDVGGVHDLKAIPGTTHLRPQQLIFFALCSLHQLHNLTMAFKAFVVLMALCLVSLASGFVAPTSVARNGEWPRLEKCVCCSCLFPAFAAERPLARY